MKRQYIRKGIILISFLLFPITMAYFSPAIPIFGALQGLVSGSLLVFVALFATSLFFGRAFCGWLCPAGGLQECCMMASNKNTKGGPLNLIKYFIWLPWLVLIIILFVLSGGFKHIDFWYTSKGGISVMDVKAYIVYYVCLALAVILSFTFGKRAFCHYLCWMAPFMVLGSKIKGFLKYPSLKLTSDSEKCVECGVCNKNCPMSLNIEEMVKKQALQDSECILCGACIDMCPKKAIKYSL